MIVRIHLSFSFLVFSWLGKKKATWETNAGPLENVSFDYSWPDKLACGERCSVCVTNPSLAIPLTVLQNSVQVNLSSASFYADKKIWTARSLNLEFFASPSKKFVPSFVFGISLEQQLRRTIVCFGSCGTFMHVVCHSVDPSSTSVLWDGSIRHLGKIPRSTRPLRHRTCGSNIEKFPEWRTVGKILPVLQHVIREINRLTTFLQCRENVSRKMMKYHLRVLASTFGQIRPAIF